MELCTYVRSKLLYKILFNFIKHSLFVTLLLHSVTVTSCFPKIDMNVYKILTIFFCTMYTCFYFIIWMCGWKMKLLLQACNTNCILLCINIIIIINLYKQNNYKVVLFVKIHLSFLWFIFLIIGRWIRYYCSMSEDLALDF